MNTCPRFRYQAVQQTVNGSLVWANYCVEFKACVNNGCAEMCEYYRRVLLCRHHEDFKHGITADACGSCAFVLECEAVRDGRERLFDERLRFYKEISGGKF